MSEIAELWARLETWANANAPKMLEDLNPGATDEQIAELEHALGRTLPASFVESLKIHNGESNGWPCKVFADMGAYHPCDAIVENRSMYLQVVEQVGVEFTDEERNEQIRDDIIGVEGPVEPVLFSPDWVPIMNCNGDVFWALDFAPADGGLEGQVIEVDHEGCSWTVAASSFDEFLAAYVTALEAGEFELDFEGLSSREPVSSGEVARDHEIHAAYQSAPATDDIRKLEAGTESEIVGMRTGSTNGDRCDLYVNGGVVKLCGSLRGATHSEPLRVRIRVGKKKGFGLVGAVHDIVSWERL